MVKPSSENGSVPPFLKKCYDMVDDPSSDSIISWSGSDSDSDSRGRSDSFVIWDIPHFSERLLPMYFKHNNFSSFIRQLNIYGFRKIDADRCEFANDKFVRGQKHLLKNIPRRKHPHISDQRKALQQPDKHNEPSQEAANLGLWKEMENLKLDKNSLMQELVKLRQHQESAENKLLLLHDRLQGMEKHQQQMLSFLVMVVQSPGFMIQLLQPEENNWHVAKAGNMLDQGKLDDKPVASDGMIIKYKPPVGEKLKPVVSRYSGFDTQPEPEFSNDGLKDLCISPEFLKVLMDEKLTPLDNHSSFLLPDLPDDGSWEQLLLDSPILGNNEDCNHENEGPIESGVEIEPTTIFETPNEESETFESLIAEMEKTQKGGLKLCSDGIHLEGMQSLESLTKQMELLTPEKNNDEEGRN